MDATVASSPLERGRHVRAGVDEHLHVAPSSLVLEVEDPNSDAEESHHRMRTGLGWFILSAAGTVDQVRKGRGERTMDLTSMTSEERTRVELVLAAVGARGFAGVFVPDRHAALAKVLELIPKGAGVAHGTSTTLEEIGFVERMRRPDSGYRYLNDE